MLADDDRVWEMLKRGGFTLNIAGRQEIQEAIRGKTGAAWLDVTAEQYANLLSPGKMK
jgi:hypothetical protein